MGDGAGDDVLVRVHRAIDHLRDQIDDPPDLAQLASVAGLSVFHFHRVFKSVVGETLGSFRARCRLERAVYLMSHATRLSLTEVALASGFGDSASFSRAFRRQFGVAPSRFDLAAYRNQHRASLARTVRDEGLPTKLDTASDRPSPIDDALHPPGAAELFERLPAGGNPDGFAVEIRERSSRTVAYLRVDAPYSHPNRVTEAARVLMEWAAGSGLQGGEWLGFTWDDPEVVPVDDCSYDVGVTVPLGVNPNPPVGIRRFPEMTVASVAIDGDIALEMRALDWLFGTWLPSSGRVPDAHPCFEVWDGWPFADAPDRFRLRIELPLI